MSNTRKLASVQRVIGTESIEGADRIEIVKVLGWQCVTQKSNNLKPGSLVVYFEVDSLLPAVPQFEFLRKKPDQTEFRLKTIRLKGKYSQGLVLPLDHCYYEGAHGKIVLKAYGDDNPASPYIKYVNEGDDLTDFLGIKKYEPEIPAQLRGKIEGGFPYFIPKTDEPRIQGCPGVLERNKGTPMYITEKIDGTSLTAYYYSLPNSDLPHKDRKSTRLNSSHRT